jgi:glycosyltransferase involved in cell wall biosynthesis
LLLVLGARADAFAVTSHSISVIVTAFNESAELRRTLGSVADNTRSLRDIIVVDDGSDDGSCQGIENDLVRVIRHEDRLGVALSRDEGSRAAQGDVLCYLDAHQRVGRGCLDQCAQVAIQKSAVVSPDIKGYGAIGWRLHGAKFQLCPKNGFFSARWRQWFVLPGVSAVTALRAPPYLIPRSMYNDVAWSRSLRGWGASEASMVVKSFFMGISILHVAGPLARHRFQKQFPYETTWDGVWRNHAIIARICFDDATWFHYWLPQIFEPHLTEEARRTIEGTEVQAEHQAFLAKKVRTDLQFWTDLLRSSPPAGI